MAQHDMTLGLPLRIAYQIKYRDLDVTFLKTFILECSMKADASSIIESSYKR